MDVSGYFRAFLEIIGGLVIIILIILRYVMPKNRNVTCKPGHGEMCLEHDRKITGLEAAIEFIVKEIPEIKQTMNDNFSKIHDILRDMSSGKRKG